MAEYEGTANPFDYKPRAVIGQLCVCGEDLGEPDNPQQGWQDWEQCPNCDLHVHHAEWIDKMVARNDELTIENAKLEAELEKHKVALEMIADIAPKIAQLEAENQRLSKRPDIKISDGDVWLVFPFATVSIEHICSYSGPIVRRNLRKWRVDALKEG